MTSDSYYVVKTTSIVKAINKTKARSLLVGEDAHGEILAQKVEVDEKDQSDIAQIISRLDESFSGNEEEDLIEEDTSNSYSSYLTVNEDVVNFLRSENKRLARLAEKNKNVKNILHYKIMGY